LEDLVEASGLSKDLKLIEQSIVTSAVEAASKNKPQNPSTKGTIDILLVENLQESFQYSLLMDEITYYLKKQVTEEDIQEALGWYRSELGQRIVQAESTSNTKESMTTIQSEMTELLNQHDLINTATQVDEAIGISNAMLDMQINTQKAMILAGLAIIDPSKDMSELERTKWTEIDEAEREARRQPIAQQYKASFVYTMKNFSQAERDQYKAFMLKPSNVKIVNAVITGISKAVEIGSYNFMAALDKDIKNPPLELQKLFNQNSTTTTTTTESKPHSPPN
jgi:hypothetical protein